MPTLDDDDELGPGEGGASAGTAPVPSFSRNLPAQLGRYLLIEQLGAGGMAEVFLAKQPGPGGFERIIVVKVLFSHLAQNPRYRKMFQREATLAARLSHINVVQVLELGPEDGPPFIAMEFVDGLSLHRLARRAWSQKRALPLELCAGAIADAALGLAYAHKDGLVHRDVSPDNLMITRESGLTKVLDFGIAKGVDSETVTKAGELKGKVPFMAPELVRGAAADACTDIYALGVSFYWLVTGRRPFRGANDIVTLQAIVTETPHTPRSINQRLPEHVDALIMKMIARNPADRPKSAAEIHEALRWALVARHSVTVPFVQEMAKLKDDESAAGDPETSGFVPSVPSLDIVKAMELTASTVRPDHDQMGGALRRVRAPRRSVLLAAAAGAALLFVLVAVSLERGGDDEPKARVRQETTRAAPLVVPPDPVARGEESVTGTEAPPPSATEQPAQAADAAQEQASVEARAASRGAPGASRVQLKAPSRVRWLDGATALGSGTRNATVKRSTTYLTALDPKRQVRSRVPIVRGTADYASLPKGRIKVRATPYAEIFLGREARGSTPYHDVEVVAGDYTLTLKNGSRVEKRVVKVLAGEESLVDVRFP